MDLIATIPTRVPNHVVTSLITITDNEAKDKSMPWLRSNPIILDSVIINPDGRKVNEPNTNDV